VLPDLGISREKYFRFIQNSKTDPFSYKFSIHSSPSPFSRCFAVFGLNLINKLTLGGDERSSLSQWIRAGLDELRKTRKAQGIDLTNDKSYLQLLTFSLTALNIIGVLEADALEDHCQPLMTNDVSANLDRRKVHLGVPQSGNYAMFMAIILLHATRYLNEDHSSKIDEWLAYHLKHMNRFGFWGDDSSMSHLQFQNGYHQYEIMHYLGAENPLAEDAADAVASLADSRGRFAPYPGGGGCYDYDAVAIITSGGEETISRHKKLLSGTCSSIIQDQNEDGGFCESKLVRPRSIGKLIMALSHAASAKGKARIERLRQALTLQRPKHDRVNGAEHWTSCGYQRGWDESNLWDSYFRMSAIARIALALDHDAGNQWSFVDYPGIGYHETLRRQDG